MENKAILSEKNWAAVAQALNDMRAKISILQQEALLRDRIFANQAQMLGDIQRELQVVKAMGRGTGATT